MVKPTERPTSWRHGIRHWKLWHIGAMLQSPETSSSEKIGHVTMLEVSAVAQEGCKLDSYHGSSEMPAAVESVSRPN